MGDYDVRIESAGLDRLSEILAARGVVSASVVTDSNVSSLYGAQVFEALQRLYPDPGMLVIPAGESSKTLETVNRLWHGFLECGMDRRSTIIALGGGVVGDLAGFAASTYMRGIDWVCLPTSLLSMVDASLGGKTGFDLAEGKNLVGSFHPPRLVLADPEALSTLPEREFRAGLAEVVKHAVIADPELFEALSTGPGAVRRDLFWILRRAVAVKVGIIEADPYERKERAALNFGHTVGHAVELVSRFRIRHGEAVAIGMVAEAGLAEKLNIAPPGLSRRIAGTLAVLGLPVHIPARLPQAELIRAMSNDKKKGGGVVHFALPAEIGRVEVNIGIADLHSIFEERGQ